MGYKYQHRPSDNVTINLSDVGAMYITKLYSNLIYQYLKCKLIGDSLSTIGAIEDKYDFNQVDITHLNDNEIDVKFKNIELQIYLRDMNISSITGKSNKGYTLLYNFEDPAYKCTWWN